MFATSRIEFQPYYYHYSSLLTTRCYCFFKVEQQICNLLYPAKLRVNFGNQTFVFRNVEKAEILVQQKRTEASEAAPDPSYEDLTLDKS